MCFALPNALQRFCIKIENKNMKPLPQVYFINEKKLVKLMTIILSFKKKQQYKGIIIPINIVVFCKKEKILNSKSLFIKFILIYLKVIKNIKS